MGTSPATGIHPTVAYFKRSTDGHKLAEKWGPPSGEIDGSPFVRRHAEVGERKTAYPINLQILFVVPADCFFLAVSRLSSSRDRIASAKGSPSEGRGGLLRRRSRHVTFEFVRFLVWNCALVFVAIRCCFFLSSQGKDRDRRGHLEGWFHNIRNSACHSDRSRTPWLMWPKRKPPQRPAKT